MSKVDDIRHIKGILYRDLFKTNLGEKVLADLEMNFNPEILATDNTHTTTVRASRADVIRYINRRINDGMDG